MIGSRPPVGLAATTRRALVALALLGALLTGAAAVLEPQRMWANWLLVSYYALTLALGGACFIAVHDASGATWGSALRRVPEALAALLPLAAVPLLVVFFARPQLYPWTHGEPQAAGTLAFRSTWLSVPFFVVRAVAYVGVWSIFVFRLRRTTGRTGALSGAFLAVFAVTFSLAAFDWVMSLEPGWYSTIFGVYHFAGLFLAAIAAIVLVVLWLERSGPLAGVVRESHLHDLGKLLFAFSTFWAYIWFSQFMLIWYADIPEETTYFVSRTSGTWYALFVLTVVLNWMVPFSVLIRRDTKRNRVTLAAVCMVVLLGRWLDLWVMMLPAIDLTPRFGLADAGPPVAAASLFVLGLVRALRARPVVPAGDPALSESLEYESYP